VTVSTDTVSTRGSGSGTVETTIGTRPIGAEGTRTLTEIVGAAAIHRRGAESLRDQADELRVGFGRIEDDGLRELLRGRTGKKKMESLASRLKELGDIGFAWTDLARMFSVSLPALRKWRQGESASPPNDLRVAEVSAICEMLSETPTISDVASWLEMPLAPECPVTGIDLLAAGRNDLLLRYARDGDGDSVLDEFDPGWRDRSYSAVEVVTGPDGLPALVARDR
jgi:hypothetical protein